MASRTRIGIIICNRYRACAGGKCLRALRDCEGAFSAYAPGEAELVGFTSCGGCPGGNVESAPEEMKKNGAEVLHLATGLVVGYPPCPNLEHFSKMIPARFGLRVVVGTHPVPQKYFLTHERLGTWSGAQWAKRLEPTLATEDVRRAYD